MRHHSTNLLLFLCNSVYGGDDMGNLDILIYYAAIKNGNCEEGNMIVTGPINGEYLEECIMNLKEQKQCEQIIIRNMMYLCSK